MKRETIEFEKFLDRETPSVGCMVCEVKYDYEKYDGTKDKRTEYFLCERKSIQGGDTYIMNGRLWYDWEFLFGEGHDWKILFKHFAE